MSDLISRQAAIDDIKAIYEYHDTVTEDRIIDHLKRLPSVEKKVVMKMEAVATDLTFMPIKEWTPVTEGLPIDMQVVNITYINREPATYYDHIKGRPMVGTAVYYRKRFYWYSVTCVDVLGEYGTNEWDEMDDRIEVKAWKPLPLPWEGKE